MCKTDSMRDLEVVLLFDCMVFAIFLKIYLELGRFHSCTQGSGAPQ